VGVVQVTAAEVLVRRRQEEPVEIRVRALQGLGGAADEQKLKVFLVGHGLVPAGEWTAFFRKAKAAAVKDPRIDHARAFEQHYQLAKKGDASAAPQADTPPPPP